MKREMTLRKGGKGKEGENRELWHGRENRLREMEERKERFWKRKERDVEKVAVGKSEEWKGKRGRESCVLGR